MKKVYCIKRCYDGKKVWVDGEVREIADDAPIPPHFALQPSVPGKPTRYDPMLPQTLRLGQPTKPQGGMATGLKLNEVLPMPTAGTEAKRREAEAIAKGQPVLKRSPGRPRKS